MLPSLSQSKVSINEVQAKSVIDREIQTSMKTIYIACVDVREFCSVLIVVLIH